MIKKSVFYLFGLALATVVLFGCAPLEKRVDLTYEGRGVGTGGSGELYVVRPFVDQQLPKMPGGRSVIGRVKDSETQIVTADSVSDWVMRALMQELYTAGYDIKTMNQVPADVPKAVLVHVVGLTANQSTDGITISTDTQVKLDAEIFRNGRRIKTLSVSTGSQDKGLDRSGEFVAESLRRTLQSAMQQLVPSIVRALEG